VVYTIKELTEQKNRLESELSTSSLDVKRRAELQKELSRTSDFLMLLQQLEETNQAIVDLRQFLQDTIDPEFQSLYKEELEEVLRKKTDLEAEFERKLYPPNPFDNRSVFLEVRAGAGGQEAALFASDLIKMYSSYALKRGWRITIVDESFTDLGGIREATLHIQGKDVYGSLKYEAGVHRVQRVPKTETSGRIHTSTATVAVFPEAEDVDLQINQSDLRIDVFRASGAGGQHVNTTDSAVRITHIPTGVVVSCQDERSQHKNKAKALKILQSRLLAHEEEKKAAEMVKQRKAMIGRGMRAEKVRTYNFPQNRVTDHQAEITLQKLDRVILGELDEIIAALQQKEREARRVEANTTGIS
jgi:peptide chain release factor 1